MTASPSDPAAPAAAAATYRIARCRSCQAPIIWATSEATGTPTPVNADPAPAGNVELVQQQRGPLARVLTKQQRAGRTDLRLPHFVTCPQRDQWRTRGRR